MSYRIGVATVSMVSILGIFSRHGFPKFSMEYIQKIAPDSAAIPLFLSFVLLASRPYILATMPLFLFSLKNVLPALTSKLADYYPAFESQATPLLGKNYWLLALIISFFFLFLFSTICTWS